MCRDTRRLSPAQSGAELFACPQYGAPYRRDRRALRDLGVAMLRTKTRVSAAPGATCVRRIADPAGEVERGCQRFVCAIVVSACTVAARGLRLDVAVGSGTVRARLIIRSPNGHRLVTIVACRVALDYASGNQTETLDNDTGLPYTAYRADRIQTA